MCILELSVKCEEKSVTLSSKKMRCEGFYNEILGEDSLSWNFWLPSWKNGRPSWNFGVPSWKNHNPSWNRENMGIYIRAALVFPTHSRSESVTNRKVARLVHATIQTFGFNTILTRS